MFVSVRATGVGGGTIVAQSNGVRMPGVKEDAWEAGARTLKRKWGTDKKEIPIPPPTF